jgi:ubiquinone/menaquinone biosynthesis C-methylase UbiE
MADDFKSARFWAREILEGAVFPGARAIDATMGGGRDALWLCGRVGEAGLVYAFDVQKEALARTRALLAAEGLEGRADLILSGHEEMEKYVPEPVDAVVFNLGWLPGGAKGVTTRVETTLAAVHAATRLLKPSGLMTICVYPGHGEGARELSALTDWASALDPAQFDVMLRRYMNQKNDPPQLIAVRRRA